MAESAADVALVRADLPPARELAVQRLSDAFAQDLVDVDEFERRIELIHQAKTPEELAPLLADLPAVVAPTAAPVGVGSTAMVRDNPHREDSRTVWAIMGGTERKGRWVVPKKLKLRTVMGGMELDFREAEFAPGVTEVQVFCLMGGVEILVPPTVAVDIQASAIMGGVDQRHAVVESTEPNRPLLRITGLVMMGGVDVQTRLVGESRREARKREKIALKAASQKRLGGGKG